MAAVARAGEGGWVNVADTLSGQVSLLAAVPDSAEVLANVNKNGLWSSLDNGATWKKIGEKGPPIKIYMTQILFDPKKPATFWFSGCYGDAPYRTDDGGASFERLSKLSHTEGIAVDFTDPERKLMLMCMHEASQSLQISKDGGKNWQKIGDKLPADSNHSANPIILDSKTFIINTSGWKQKASLGIYRSEDAGESWTRVSDFGPFGTPLVASDGAIYWQRIWEGGLIKSTDQGKTWTQIGKQMKTNPIELPDKRLAGLSGSQVVVSSDGGATWTNVGEPAPFKPNGIIYSSKGKCFYAWSSDNKMVNKGVARLNVP